MPLAQILPRAIDARRALIDDAHAAAFRLFAGFYEGEPELAADVYARTLVFHDYADDPDRGLALCQEALEIVRGHLPWIVCAVAKRRAAASAEERRGAPLLGSSPDTCVTEHGVRYAVDLTMNRDASLYLDTRELRRWALGHLAGRTVLNTFAYTGSLGIAALAGGAAHVVQLDLNRRFLRQAEQSCALNSFELRRHEILAGDFFPRVSQLKRAGRMFDCIFLDPPFFAATARGTVDLENDLARLINKVRPLVAHDGRLAVVNNALYVSGARFMDTLTGLCADGYLTLESLVPVPEDFTGYAATRVGAPVTDPAPFNHATKIAILRVRRKGHATSPSAE